MIRSALQSQMAQAAILGESQEKIIKRIQKVTGQAEYQARRIAQTERNRVQSQARAEALHEAAKMGITVTKTWSARMRNTRDSHAALNGTEIPESEKFHTIWGNELRYPGDPEAPAAEVINCFCVLIPDVKLPRESAADRLKKEAESGIIEGEGSLENAAEKAASIEKTFKYSDAWGDEYSPIDRASFAAMPAQAQQRAADGIRKAQELFKLDALPDKIGFKKLGKGVFGEYSETRRALYLSSIECQDPEKAFGTMVHELTHYYDQVNGHISEKVYKQALKELGLRANGKEADNLLVRLVGVKYKKEDRVPEALAFAVELSQKGTQNKLAKKIFEIIMR